LCYTIAEGIETKGDSEKINHIGIYLHQGWYHGRPMSAEKITAYTV
jgi:EAL domain-containing protein (putative c-di-GMP-specific phosphodiesterase class I)